ncbi:MAG: glycosyltransferase family 2 protein [Phycisphaeraceae bacterium]|nr:glycosyltransferase family 2 protein [Phycisphaeraceae bacterium]
MPVFNERALVGAAVDRVVASPALKDATGNGLERTLIVIDDGSTDGTDEIVRQLGERAGVRVECMSPNRGKGSAVRRGIALALEMNADIVVIHDADLEYDPADHAALLAPILDGRADAVIGSRFLGQTHRVLYFWHYLANRAITTLSNLLTNLNLSDIECCLKAFSRDVALALKLKEDRFGIEPEIIARLAGMEIEDELNGTRVDRSLRIFEVPVTYSGRTYSEGKKIRWQDGIEAVAVIVRRNLWD